MFSQGPPKVNTSRIGPEVLGPELPKFDAEGLEGCEEEPELSPLEQRATLMAGRVRPTSVAAPLPEHLIMGGSAEEGLDASPQLFTETDAEVLERTNAILREIVSTPDLDPEASGDRAYMLYREAVALYKAPS